MGLFSRLFGRHAVEPSSGSPRILAHEAFDGAIRVLETPTSTGWEPSEARRDGDGFEVMVLKYVLPMSPMPLALLAKIYRLAAGREQPPEPSKTDWRATFQPLFSSITSVEARPARQLTMKSSVEGCEAVLDGVGAEPAVPLRIRERRAVVGHEQLIVTAIGTPESFAAHASEIESWFSTSAFTPEGEELGK